ncbi:MAG TPA: TRAP transporter substrate-binding protein, partial [Thermoanaerobacterales bacterium]|nr:TRAP transporter substrate-binding protein [Thermoanaerobacterales bacterium]
MITNLKSNKYLAFALLICLSFVFVAGCGGSNSTSTPSEEEPQETIELTFAHHWPAKHKVETVMAQGWAKAIEEATDGRIKIVTYPGETLIPAAENYEGVVQGVADIGLSVYGYTRGRFPLIETFLLPGINAKSSEVLSHAAMEVINKFNPKEIQDTKHLWTFGSGPMDIISNKPIRKLEDLKGMMLGVPGGLGAVTLESLGGSPVSQPMSEWYESLQKGVMQGGVVAVNAMEGFRLGEVTGDYITLTPFLPQQLFYCVMNLEKWNSLPPDLQQTIIDVTEEFYPGSIPGVWDQENAGAVKRLSEKKP